MLGLLSFFLSLSQLQHLQQLQALLLQHLANEATPPGSNANSAQKGEESSQNGKVATPSRSGMVQEEQLPVSNKVSKVVLMDEYS